jgi:hypothetical protein
LTEAERQFKVALRQSAGAFDEAALKLCRSRLTATTKSQVAALKVVETAAAPIK